MSDRSTITRRRFLAGTAVAGLAMQSFAASDSKPYPPLVCFSKHLQFIADFNRLADTLAQLGFDGADLTVRQGGHILPEHVERDLPKAVEALRQVGLDVHMISTDIFDPDDPRTETTLKTASSLHIPYYRIGTWQYQKEKGIIEQLDALKARIQTLASMNAHYGLRAGYHNHSGKNYIGGSLWEIHEIFRDADPHWMGYNFDAAHAVAEGAGGSWLTTFQVVKPQIMGIAVKDSLYEKSQNGSWQLAFPPLGEGMVDWPFVLRQLKEASFTGPISMHFEYDVPGEGEERQKNELNCIQRDRNRLAELLQAAGLRS